MREDRGRRSETPDQTYRVTRAGDNERFIVCLIAQFRVETWEWWRVEFQACQDRGCLLRFLGFVN